MNVDIFTKGGDYSFDAIADHERLVVDLALKFGEKGSPVNLWQLTPNTQIALLNRIQSLLRLAQTEEELQAVGASTAFNSRIKGNAADRLATKKRTGLHADSFWYSNPRLSRLVEHAIEQVQTVAPSYSILISSQQANWFVDFTKST